jgi:hypothetical protein
MPFDQPLIGFSTSNDWLGEGIRQFESFGDGGKAAVSHAFFAYRASGQWVILGENLGGFTPQWVSDFEKSATIVVLYAPLFDLARALYDTASAKTGGIGSPYDFPALAGMMAVEFFAHFHRHVPNVTDVNHRCAFCSEKVVEVLQKIAPPLACAQGVTPDCEDPEKLERLLAAYPQNFKNIGAALPG